MVQFLDPRTMPSRAIHTLLYGATRIGKTTSAATWPRPAFLSVAMEGGDTTLRSVADSKQGVTVAQIRSTDEMLAAVDHIARNPGMCDTVVVDSLTFLCDMWIAELTQKRKAAMRPPDWGALDLFVMKNLLPRLRQLRQHVVWIALEKEHRDPESGALLKIAPMLYGAQADKLPAATDFIIRMDKMPFQDPTTKMFQQVRVFLTAPNGPYMAGGRFGDLFQDGVLHPSWQAIEARIGQYLGNAHAPPVQVPMTMAAPPPQMQQLASVPPGPSFAGR